MRVVAAAAAAGLPLLTIGCADVDERHQLETHAFPVDNCELCSVFTFYFYFPGVRREVLLVDMTNGAF